MTDTRQAGKPVLDVKTAFKTALKDPCPRSWTSPGTISGPTTHPLVMAGVSLRAEAVLLRHKGLRMVMRYAHFSPGFLSEK